MIDTGLLNKALEAIELHPEQHAQETWRCATGQCLAGWVGLVSGVPWADPENEYDARIVNEQGEIEHVSDYAEEKLGESVIENLTRDEYYSIFPEGRPYYGPTRMIAIGRRQQYRDYETESFETRDYDEGVFFNLFGGENTREQLRAALEVIERRQSS